MTDREIEMCRALANVTMIGGTRKKRFVQQMIALDPAWTISARQALYLRKLVHHFRRQIPNYEALLAPSGDLIDAVKIVAAEIPK